MSILYNNDRPQHLFGKRNLKSLFKAIEREQENRGTL